MATYYNQFVKRLLKHNSLITYVVAFIVSVGVIIVTDGALLGLSLRCTMSLGCIAGGGSIYITAVIALFVVYGIAYVFTKPNPTKLFIVVFLLPIPALLSFDWIAYTYKYGARDRIIASAKKHRSALRVGEYRLLTEPDSKTIMVNIFIPFTVDKSFDANVLPYMFESQSSLDGRYPLSSNPLCNEAIYDSIIKNSAITHNYALFGSRYFLDPPDSISIEHMARLDLATLESFDLLSKNRKQRNLQSGRTYYVYSYISVNTTQCSETDFANHHTSSPIYIK